MTTDADDRLAGVQEELAAAVDVVVSSGDWQAALAAAARFHKYSFDNVMLIWSQQVRAFVEGRVPVAEPSMVAGLRQWEAMGRNVIKGQHGFSILRPNRVEVREVREAGSEEWRRLGRLEKPPSGAVERRRSMLSPVKPFAVATVFDICQTEGAPIPTPPLPTLLTGAAPDGLWDGLAAQLAGRGFDLEDAGSDREIGGANGVTWWQPPKVAVRADMDPLARVKTLAHETGHVWMHDPRREDGTVDQSAALAVTRGVKEVEAESFAFVIGAAHGMDTSGYSLDYIAHWAGDDAATTVRQVGARVTNAARIVLDGLSTVQWGNGQPPDLAARVAEQRAEKAADRQRHRPGARGAAPPRGGPVNRPTSPHAASQDRGLAFAILGAAAIVGVLWAGGAAALWSAGIRPHGPAWAGVSALLSHRSDPGRAWGSASVPPTRYWVISGLVGLTAIAVTATITLLARRRGGTAAVDVFRLPGTASAAEIRRTCSPRAVARRGRVLRPSLPKPGPRDVGFLLGTSRAGPVWASVEDSVVVLGPARSGKDLHLVVNVILDAPGAVISTSTRPDNIHQTIAQRSKLGPVAVFDPQGLAGDTPAGLRWSLTRGCDRPMTAMIRATGLAAGSGKGVDDGDFWRGQTEAALRSLLMAAALDGRGAIDLYRWSLTPAAVQDAIAILDSHPRAPEGWATALAAVADSDPRQRDSVWLGVRQALAALGDPNVLRAVSPQPGEHFDPAEFLTHDGTLYLVGTSTGAGAAANLVSAFIEDILETARQLAATSPGARLDPPVTMMLNEIGNLAPLPSLPMLMSEGGGTGICAWAVLQSLAQARHRWGDQPAATVWDACTSKIILGGGANANDLRDLSALIGERDEQTWAETRAGDGTRSHSTSLRRIPVLDPGRLRTLPFGAAVLLDRSIPPAVIRLRKWTDRHDLQDQSGQADRLGPAPAATKGDPL